VQIAQHGDVELPRRSAQIGQNHARTFRIQTRHRLVGKNGARLLCQCSGYTDALLLSAGKPLGATPCALFELDAAQTLQGELDIMHGENLQDGLPRGHICEASGEHVLQHGQSRHEVVILKNHRRFAAYRTQPFSIGGDWLTGDPDLARIRRRQSVDTAQQGGLAGTRRPEHHQKLARRNAQVDFAQRDQLAVAFSQTAHFDHFNFLRSRLSTLAASRTKS
jgi:hypothetical protein